MALSFDVFGILLLLAPFGAAVLAPTISRETGRAAGWILALVPAGLFAALISTVTAVAAGHPVRLTLEWVPVLGLKFDFLIDGLALGVAISEAAQINYAVEPGPGIIQPASAGAGGEYQPVPA